MKSAVFGKIRQQFNRLVEASQRSVDAYGAQYNAFCLFFVVNYVFVLNHWAMVGPYPHVGLWALRLSACLFTLILFFRKYWPESLKKYLPLYWFFVLFYCLSFRTVYTILYSEYTTTFKYFGVMGLILMAVLVDWQVFSILITLGLILGIPFFYLTGGLAADVPSTTTLFFAAYGYAGCIFLKLVFSRNNEIAFQNRLSDLRLWAGSIAHDVRVHIQTLKGSLDGLKPQIGILSQAHDYACRNGYVGPQISEEQLKRLEAVISQFSGVAERAIMMIELQLAEARNKSNRGEPFSIVECIETSMQEFHFEPGERELIQIDLNVDCLLVGKPGIFSLLLVNLIKNALEAICVAQKGMMQISTTQTKSHFILTVKDTGLGVRQEDLPRIFDDFFTTKLAGTGIGLAISKKVVELHGGKIECVSAEGEFTEFICKFPLKITKLGSYQ